MNAWPQPEAQAIADTVCIACQLAGGRDVGSVQVLLSRRPTYDELIRFRHWADVRGLDLEVSASGISFHRHRQQAPAIPSLASIDAPRGRYAADFVGISSVLDWVQMQKRCWRSRFSATNQGKR